MCPSPRQAAALISAAALSIRRFEGHILGLPDTARSPSSNNSANCIKFPTCQNGNLMQFARVQLV